MNAPGPTAGEPGDRRPGRDPRRDARGRQRGLARTRGADQRSAGAPSSRRRTGDPARATAFDVLRQVEESDSYANLVLPPLLRARSLSGRDAAFATELAYGTLRLRGRYDAVLSLCVDRPLDRVDPPVLDLLRLGAHQLLGMRVPVHAAVSETVALARDRIGVGGSQFANAVLRRVGERDLEEWLARLDEELSESSAEGSAAAGELARLSRAQSHPLWIVRALRDALAGHGRDRDELAALLTADNEAPRVTLAARPGLVAPDDLDREVLEVTGRAAAHGRWAPTARILPGADPVSVPAVRDRRAGVQDEGSQLVTLAFASAPVTGSDERWLDLCAGPGGKAALLAALAAQRGARLVANELAPHRAELVRQSLSAAPAGSVEEVRVGDGRTVGEAEPGSFDRVLVDAPCTGLGALRRRPESRWRRTPADLAALTVLQRALLRSALDAVRPGGVVAYVTCSPHLAETQLAVQDALAGRDDVEVLDAVRLVQDVAVEPVPLPGRPDVQLWPHAHGTDAMYLSVLRRR